MIRQTILHSITGIMVVVVVAADVMDTDKGECFRILPVRHPRCRDSNNYVSRRFPLRFVEFGAFCFRPSSSATLAGGKRQSRHFLLHASDRNGDAVLREWRAREKILRRHRRDSGLIVSVEVSGSRAGYAIFIVIRIGEPEDYVV